MANEGFPQVWPAKLLKKTVKEIAAGRTSFSDFENEAEISFSKQSITSNLELQTGRYSFLGGGGIVNF